MAKERLFDLDSAKGFAIFLVVVGHILSGAPLYGNDWFIDLTNLIYRFHMPFFMFLSGAILYYTYKPLNSSNDYFRYINKKALRLLPGFFLFGLLILLGKVILSSIIFVDDVPTDLFSELIRLLIYPYNSAAGSLWYIYVLFEFYLIVPLILTLIKDKLWIVVVFGLVIKIIGFYFKVTDLLLLNLFIDYLFFFSLGFYFIQNYKRLSVLFQNNFIIFFAIFLCSFFTIYFLQGKYNKLIIGLSSLPAVYSLVNQKFFIKYFDKSLQILGEYTYSIYLMNTLTMGFLKGLLLKFMPWDGLNFLIYLPLLLVAGIILPIIIHKYILSKIGYLGKITK